MKLCAPALALALALGMPIAAADAAENAGKQPLAEVALPPILAPMAVQGRLQGYAHLTISVRPSGVAQVLVIREKVPFLQDAFLRELNKGSLVKSDEPGAVDVAATTQRLFARAKQILPPGSVSAVRITNLAYVPLAQD